MTNQNLLLSLAVAATVCATAAAQPFPEQIELGNFGPGEGFTLLGISQLDDAGRTVRGIGDIDGDGFDDVAVASLFADVNGTNSGEVYVIFGFPSALLSSLSLDDLDGTNGFRIAGVNMGDELGEGLAGPGDVNGDGFDDLLIGAPKGDANGPNAGEVFVVFGRASFPAVFDLRDLDGENGARIDRKGIADFVGSALSGAGDFNGDGIDDFVVGSDALVGEIYVGFGRTMWPQTLELDSLNGETGFTIEAIAGQDQAGSAVEAAGDVNGDGLSDIVIGARNADPNGASSGDSYVVFGRETTPAVVQLADLDGTNGTTIHGEATFSFSGKSVSGVADIDEDGFDDLLIGAPGTGADGLATGTAYVIYGRAMWPAEIELFDLAGSDGVQLNGDGASDETGESVSGGFDFNGDGRFDLVVGAPAADPSGPGSGAAYVVFGDATRPGTIELRDLNGSNGTTLAGEFEFGDAGTNVSQAGDFNGDGLGDLIVGSPEADSRMGRAYVVFGLFETGVTLGATGAACPGPIQLRSKGLTPNGDLDIYRGSGRGTTTIPAGPCAGSTLGLANAQRIRTVEANDLGQWLLSISVASETICGTYIQLIDNTTCLESNVTTVLSQ